jgi:hypothetical protein
MEKKTADWRKKILAKNTFLTDELQLCKPLTSEYICFIESVQCKNTGYFFSFPYENNSIDEYFFTNLIMKSI